MKQTTKFGIIVAFIIALAIIALLLLFNPIKEMILSFIAAIILFAGFCIAINN